MVNLTFLNDASVFWNLKTRYQAKMIHTYSGLEKTWLKFKLFLFSGLFVVVVNPYKRYPLYTHRVCKIYLGKRRNEVPEYQQLQRKCNLFESAIEENCILLAGASSSLGYRRGCLQEHVGQQEGRILTCHV